MHQLIFILFFICNIDARVLETNSSNTTSEIMWTNEEVFNQDLQSEPSLGTVVINTQVLTIFNYQGSQIYV